MAYNSNETVPTGAVPSTANSTGTGLQAYDSGAKGADAAAILECSTDFAAHGTKSIKVATGAVANVNQFGWNVGNVPTFVTSYSQIYLRLNAAPGSNTTIWRLTYGGTSGTTTLGGSVLFMSTGTLRLNDFTGTNVCSVPAAEFPLNAWFRLQLKVVHSATVGTGEMRVFKGTNLEGTSPDYTTTALTTTANTGTGCEAVRIGNTTSVANIGPWYFDDPHITGDGYPAPVGSGIPAVQTLAPTSDITTSGWTYVGGDGTSAWSAVDEPTADDSDYVASPSPATSSVLEIKFGPAVDPAVSTGHVVSYRLRAAGTSHSVVVALMEGTTSRASWTHTNLTSAFQTFTQTLTGVQADSITDYTNLRLRVTATAS